MSGRHRLRGERRRIVGDLTDPAVRAAVNTAARAQGLPEVLRIVPHSAGFAPERPSATVER